MHGDGRIYQRGTTWWVEYWHRGQQVRESSKSPDRRVAQRLLQTRRRTAGTAQFIAPKTAQLPFHELPALYLTDQRVNRRRSLDHAERYARNLLAAFGGDRALDVTADSIEAYRDQRLADGLAPASVNRELAALRRMFKLAVRKGKLPASPHIETLDESGNVREGFLEPPEFEAVCALLPDYLQDAARFAYLTGWRVGAIRALEWRDVDLRARTLQLHAAHAKNKRAKLLPLTAALLELIERRAVARDLARPFVFPGAAGGRLGDFRKAWKRACATAGVRGVVFHDLRRSGARNAVRAGVPEQVVMELGGWRTRAVFARYNVTSERDLADAIARVSDYVADRAADAPKIRPIHGEPAQNPHNRASGGSSRKAETRVRRRFP
jgi:integrase